MNVLYTSLADAFRANTRPVDGGHLVWTGYTDATSGTPRVCYRNQRYAVPRAAFLLHHGREPIGNPQPTCGMNDCVAGPHLADRPIRQANQRADRLYTAIFGEGA